MSNSQNMVAQYHELTDSQWEIIKEYLPIQRKRKYDLRIILNAIFWILRTGSQWRNLDSKFPKWQLVYYYFRKWTLDGTIETINWQLSQLERLAWDKKKDPSLVCVDSQSVKVVPFSYEDVGVDGFKKVNGRKRHIVVDTLGLIVGVIVHAANHFDSPKGIEVIARCDYRFDRLKKIIVDQAYRGSFVDDIYDYFNGEVQVEITSRNKRSSRFEVIPKRWIVERTFAIMTFFRRLSKDYEKTVESSEAMVLLMNSWMILSRFNRR